MKVFVSIDLEGIAGVCMKAQTDDLGSDTWRAACELMQADLDAVFEACDDAGVDEIVVGDGHYKGDNLGIGGLPANASLVSGAHWDLSMMQGIDDSFDAALFVGYHARAGTTGAVLNHTYMDALYRVVAVATDETRTEVGELGINAPVAGAFGVPAIFASGDDKLAAEARELIPGIKVAIVKEGVRRGAARLLAPDAAHGEIRAGVARALDAERRPAPLDWTGRALEVSFARTDFCDDAADCPGVERLDARTVRIAAPDYLSVFRSFIACISLIDE